MKKVSILLILLLMIIHFPSRAELALKAQAGISYIEHFSLGVTLSFSERHNLSLLYGSNAFIKPQDFSSFMLQYELLLKRINFARITPKIGIEGGYSIYTNDYYQWNLINIVPFIGFNYQVNNKIEIPINLGVVISHEQSVKRITYGNIGKYKEYLPEIKFGIVFKL
jgi:hypothetical protein